MSAQLVLREDPSFRNSLFGQLIIADADRSPNSFSSAVGSVPLHWLQQVFWDYGGKLTIQLKPKRRIRSDLVYTYAGVGRVSRCSDGKNFEYKKIHVRGCGHYVQVTNARRALQVIGLL